MVNQNIFKNPTKVNTKNEAGGIAYEHSKYHALAQLAVTNCFNGTYYLSEKELFEQTNKIISDCKDVNFLAKLAVYARKNAFMKDMPVFILAHIANIVYTSKTNHELFHKVFDKVIDNGKMLRVFCSIIRSGVVKKFNFNGMIKKAIQRWFDKQTSENIFRASVGQEFPMKYILKLVHPKPNTPEKNALFGYLLGKEYDNNLPEFLKQYEAFKKDNSLSLPNVDFRYLTSLDLTKEHWKDIAKNAPWQMTRMNLNSFQKHGVFEDKEMVNLISARLSNQEEIKKARQFPYQIYTAFKQIKDEINPKIGLALQKAIEISTENIPEIGNCCVCIDVSGSMSSLITGKGTVRCVEVAALIASSILRTNKEAVVVPFDTAVRKVKINPNDSIATNCEKLTINGGGTDCSVALKELNKNDYTCDVVIFISDNQSWYGLTRTHGKTNMMQEWDEFKKRNKEAKLICIDLTPNVTSQVKNRKDILQIGGWSDTIFDVIASFVRNNVDEDRWIKEINSVEL